MLSNGFSRMSPPMLFRVIDELLASPRFGERWVRHWLDLVRYAETYGHEFDYPIEHAWQYRDYVIRAERRCAIRSICHRTNRG